jgi:hypothetical protein
MRTKKKAAPAPEPITKARKAELSRADMAELIKTKKKLAKLEGRFFKLQYMLRDVIDLAEDLDYTVQDHVDTLDGIIYEALNPEG